jgi:hypothetical protein
MQLPYYLLAFEYFFLLSASNTDNTFNTYNTNNTRKTDYTHNTHPYYAQRILNTTI